MRTALRSFGRNWPGFAFIALVAVGLVTHAQARPDPLPRASAAPLARMRPEPLPVPDTSPRHGSRSKRADHAGHAGTSAKRAQGRRAAHGAAGTHCAEDAPCWDACHGNGTIGRAYLTDPATVSWYGTDAGHAVVVTNHGTSCRVRVIDGVPETRDYRACPCPDSHKPPHSAIPDIPNPVRPRTHAPAREEARTIKTP